MCMPLRKREKSDSNVLQRSQQSVRTLERMYPTDEGLASREIVHLFTMWPQWWSHACVHSTGPSPEVFRNRGIVLQEHKNCDWGSVPQGGCGWSQAPCIAQSLLCWSYKSEEVVSSSVKSRESSCYKWECSQRQTWDKDWKVSSLFAWGPRQYQLGRKEAIPEEREDEKGFVTKSITTESKGACSHHRTLGKCRSSHSKLSINLSITGWGLCPRRGHKLGRQEREWGLNSPALLACPPCK